MKVLFVSLDDPYNISKWSGTVYFIRKMMEDQGHELKPVYDFPSLLFPYIVVKKVLAKIRNKKYSPVRDTFVSKFYSRYVEKHITDDIDIIFSVGSIPIAFVNTNKPIFFYTDAVFKGMIDFYPTSQSLTNKCIRDGHKIEQAAFDRSVPIYSSFWAKEIAESYYQVAKNKIQVVPLGANLESSPSIDIIQTNIKNRSSKVIKILFVGVEWERKGADIVFDTVQYLHDKGCKVELHILGLTNIPLSIIPDFVVNHGFVKKDTQQGRCLIDRLFADCHFMFVPSRAEAYGLVFSEASAYGIPSISHKVGGISTIVKDDINGKLFPLNTSPVDFAKYIIKIFNDKDAYINLCNNSYKEYVERLNWNTAGKNISKITSECISK